MNGRSRRPLDELGGELGLVYGDNDTKEIHGDITGGLTDNIDGRLTALYRDKGRRSTTSTSSVNSSRQRPQFKFGDNTRLTLLSYYQKDEVDGETNGFLPAYGVSLPNPLGKVPPSRNLGEPDYNRYTREQWAAGYDFVHNFSDRFSLQQNFKYISSKSKMLVVYGGGLVDADFDGTPDDYHTVQRYNFPFDEAVSSGAVDTRVEVKFDTGPLRHTMLAGLDYRKYDNEQSFGSALLRRSTCSTRSMALRSRRLRRCSRSSTRRRIRRVGTCRTR